MRNEHIDQTELRAVIFDVDGTLVDSNDLHVRAWVEAFGQYGKRAEPADVHTQIGKGGDEVMPEFLTADELRRFGEELDADRAELFKEKFLPLVKPIPKVKELFERIKADGLRIALASSSKEQEVEQHKKNLGIEELVDAATSSDDAERSKPNPDIFEVALKKLEGVSPGQAIVVGDSPWDVLAATKAGMRTIGVLTGGFTREELLTTGAIEVYESVGDLLNNYERSVLHARVASGAAGK
jgi:HAD superfamily hydrolase (TIGR01509 family)